MRRSRCLICGELTGARRYAALRWTSGAGIVDCQWFKRRICDDCADTAESQILEVVLEEVRVPRDPEPSVYAGWEWERY